mgnify:CR=1 FL=1
MDFSKVEPTEGFAGDQFGPVGSRKPTDKDGNPRIVFEPSPLTGGAGWTAYIGFGINICLHIATVICIFVACIPSIPKSGEPVSRFNGHDYPLFWCVAAPVAYMTGFIITVGYYSCVKNANNWALPGILSLGLFIFSALCLVQLQSWIVTGHKDTSERNEHQDGVLQAALILNCFAVASYLYQPIAANTQKINGES